MEKQGSAFLASGIPHSSIRTRIIGRISSNLAPSEKAYYHSETFFAVFRFRQMTDTLAFYNQNAAQFFANTVGVDMGTVYARFLPLIPANGLILDAGCGSGRDAKAFLMQGYRVRAFDASPQLAQLASEHIGRPVAVQSFLELTDERCYDGIWACASLLHLPEVDVPDALRKLWTALKPGGVLYLSFKVGFGEREHQGRHFTDASETRLRDWLTGLSEIDRCEFWVTTDQRPNRTEEWLNAIIFRESVQADKLIAGGKDPFLPHLSTAIARASEIDMAVAFIKSI